MRWPLNPLHKAQPPFVAIHASQQLTFPIVSYLWDFRDRLVPYYWHCFFKLFWQIWEKESQNHPTCLSFNNFNIGHHHRPRLLGVSNFEQNPRCPPWFSERNHSPAAGRFHDPHRDLAVGTEGLCFRWPADVHATCSPMTFGKPEFQRTLVPDWKGMACSSHGDKWEKARSSQSTGWQSRNMAKYAGVQIFVHSPTSIDLLFIGHHPFSGSTQFQKPLVPWMIAEPRAESAGRCSLTWCYPLFTLIHIQRNRDTLFFGS